MTTSKVSEFAFFSDSQARLVKAALDQIIPAEGRYPGAGELGIAAHLDGLLAKEKSLRRLFANGIALIEMESARTGSAEFSELDAAHQIAVLKQVETAAPEFMAALIRHTYNGYYTNRRVLEACGAPLKPPQPTGHVLGMGDLSALEAVKSRGQAFRDV